MSVIALLFASALAADPGVVVVPGALRDDGRLLTALTLAGLGEATLVAPDDFVASFHVVSVTSRSEDCAGAVPTEDWRERFLAARERVQLLDFATSLRELVALELELVCVSAPLATSDLFRLQLALAEAHSFLARSVRNDADRRAFHEAQAATGLLRAARFGGALSPPPDLDPDVLVAYDAVLEEPRPADPPRVVVAGPGARVGARFNGRPLGTGAFEAVAGTNIVQAASGASVSAAAAVRLEPGSRTLLWLAPGGTPRTEGDVVQQIVALSRESAGAEGIALLAAAATLADPPVAYVSATDAGVSVWSSDGATLVPLALEDRPRTASVEAWRGVVGLAGGAGWSGVGGGELDGLGGGNAGFALYGRARLHPWFSLALAAHPSAVASQLTPEQGGGTLFRATVPVRAGLRVGRGGRALAPEVGLDAGVHYFGSFDAPRASFLVVGAGGLTGAVGPAVGLRIEVFGGAGLGYGLVGGFAGVEWRL